jgi:hypothetical protein
MSDGDEMNREDIDKQRKAIEAKRVFRADYLGAGRIKYTCTTCGAAKTKDLKKEGLTDAAVKRVVASHKRHPPKGTCNRCTRRERDA